MCILPCMTIRILKGLMTLFLLICIGVHVAGLLHPFSSEPTWSHIVHTISYCLCLYSVIRPAQISWLLYTIGAIYPFMYHARCAWTQYTMYQQLSAICILVVVLIPAGVWLTRQAKTG